MPAPEHQAELLAALKYQPGLRPLAMTRPKRPPAHSFCFVPSRIGFQPRCHQQRRPKKLKTNGSRAAQNRYLIAYILSFTLSPGRSSALLEFAHVTHMPRIRVVRPAPRSIDDRDWGRWPEMSKALALEV